MLDNSENPDGYCTTRTHSSPDPLSINGETDVCTGTSTSAKYRQDDWRLWLKLERKFKEYEWLRELKWMNRRGPPNSAYIPTQIEHMANVVTHGIWIIPAVYCTLQLLWRSDTSSKIFVATVYGVALTLLFFISTFFHCMFYCNRNRQLKDFLHRCDRAMIYIFIAGSYFPWLSLSTPVHSNLMTFLKWFVWTLAAMGIAYQQLFHEKYKCLETFFYIVMGVGPSIVIVCWGQDFNGLTELKVGGFVYLLGICFFKADGKIPCAHAIWHLFVVMAAAFHYYAILNYLYPAHSLI